MIQTGSLKDYKHNNLTNSTLLIRAPTGTWCCSAVPLKAAGDVKKTGS